MKTAKQMNIRMDSETLAELTKLRQQLSSEIGVNLGHSDVFRMGLKALREKHPEPAKKGKS